MNGNHQGRRILITSGGEVKVERFPIRAPGENEVLMETVSTLISAGTELGRQEMHEGDFFPGYSNAGKIIALGAHVKAFSIEERVLSLGMHATHA